MGADKLAKKRPRDILASLDAAFASSATSKTSKYTAQAAQQTNAAAAQQAYQHSKHKKKKLNQQNQQKTNQASAAGGQKNQQLRPQQQQKEQEPYEPLYGRLDIDTLRVGLKNCSLSTITTSMQKTNVLHATLKQYIGGFANESKATAMTNKLKNKVLQFDNPIRATDGAKQRAVHTAQAQSCRLLSARKRRTLGLHMVAADAIEYSDAEKLCEIWRRYARDVIGNDFVGDHSDVAARTARLQAKLRAIDLSGCPIEVIKARNPLNVGTVGIIVADKTHVIQVCVPGRGKVITLPKQELRFCVSLDEHKSFFMDGRWLLGRKIQNP